MAVRTNLVTNPSFEVDTAGWSAFSPGQINRTTTTAYLGSASASLPTLGTNAAFVTYGFNATNNTGTASAWAVTPGQVYTVSYYAKAISAAGTVGIRDIWLDASNNFLSDDGNGTLAAVDTATWTRITRTSTVPTSAAKMSFAIVGGIGIYIDAVQIELAGSVGTYFDGSTVNAGYTYAWTGTANASTSTETTSSRTNYSSNPSLESNLTGVVNNYSGYATTALTRETSGGYVGSSFARVTWSTAASAYSGSLEFDSSAAMPAGSLVGTVMVRVNAPQTLFLNAVGTGVSGVSINIVEVPANTWTKLTVTGTAAANATPQLLVQTPGSGTNLHLWAAGNTLDVDAIAILTAAGTYFDGSSTQTGYTYAWTGTPNNSSSTESTAAAAQKTISSPLSGSGALTASLVYQKRISSALSGSGALTASLVRTVHSISAALSGSGTLSSSLAYQKRISSALSGSGTLGSKLPNRITSQLSDSGALTSALVHRLLNSSLSGSGSLASHLYRSITSGLSGSGALTSVPSHYQRIASPLSGSGSLTSALKYQKRIFTNFYGQGWLASALQYRKHFTSALGAGEGVLYSELGYVVKPAELGTTPLGKLVSFNVSTSAVPLDPAEGAGAAPSVSAGYTKGTNPEFMLGETNTLSHGAVGTYSGEVVRLSLPEGSDVASLSQDTSLTLLNTNLNLYPFIDAAPSTWTAARAIEYWTQQCGLFYDAVPGNCIAYASGFGHTDSYGADTIGRFYEKLAGGATTTVLLGKRSVKSLGSAVTGTTSFHDSPNAILPPAPGQATTSRRLMALPWSQASIITKGSGVAAIDPPSIAVPVSVPRNRKLVASVGLGLLGTGRTATVTWNLMDTQQVMHNVVITATSEGSITASLGGVPVQSTTVPAGGNYRVAFSIEVVSSTAVVTKLSVHTDNLDGTGAQVYASPTTAFRHTLPTVMYLTSLTHVSAGGSGAEMLRWGTYLSVAAGHPLSVPAIQKALSQTGKSFGFVSGFEGNVWTMLNEYCAITRQDVSFLNSQLTVTPRITSLTAPASTFAKFSRDSQRRDKYKQVAVVNKQSVAVSTNDAVLWRADSVFQVAAREVFETTVQTPHSILSLVQPVPVGGILPFPYKQGGGQYVVTGADGYIVAPQWWIDNGGKLEVSLTGKAGEIGIKITAPQVDTVRAPYRISEGAGDRPALYIAGSGILNKPKEVHVGTGARPAKEGFDKVFDSPFMAGPMETYDTAAAMAAVYSSSVADAQFELPNDFYTPSRFGQFPAGTRFTDGKRTYRIKTASQTHNRVSGNAIPQTTIGDYVASYPAGSTIADEKARHTGRTIKQFNLSPLRSSN